MRVTSAGLGFFTAAVVVALARAVPASAGPFGASVPLDITAGDPYAACPPIGAGVNFPDAEVEPFVGVNPVNPANIVAVYQQDRYSNGASKGTVSSASFDGGLTWLQRPVPADTVCTGGKYDRASDPWVTFGPDGVAHAMSLVTDADPPAGFGDNGMAYNRSSDGGRTWEPAQLLIEDTDPRFLNDNNSMEPRANRTNQPTTWRQPPGVSGGLEARSGFATTHADSDLAGTNHRASAAMCSARSRSSWPLARSSARVSPALGRGSAPPRRGLSRKAHMPSRLVGARVPWP